MALFKLRSGLTAWDEHNQKRNPTDRDFASEKKGKDNQKKVERELSNIEKMRAKYTY